MPRLTTVASALIYLFVVLAVAAVVYLLASLVFGRGEQLAPLPPGSTPTRLPPADIEGADVRALRFQQVLRGYKASEVDWALERLAGELDELHGRIAVLERQLDAAGEQLQAARAGRPDEPED
ncbi:DivIVA domain-containing protein [Saccharopolyspora shandongensis]|uniref:DivIVA domain-containing protein n=1 Tax=Saccharopolyspora shandongensis TaxID=418495 RepID=A0A1H3PNH8_9PSEU|nr:DivIVA domain-containing protein [Saccharopolyspora shandongensis]